MIYTVYHKNSVRSISVDLTYTSEQILILCTYKLTPFHSSLHLDNYLKDDKAFLDT